MAKQQRFTLIVAWLRQRENGLTMPARIPIGALYLITAMKRAGYAVDLRDCQLLDNGFGHNAYSTQDMIYQVCKDAGDLIGISCMNDLLPAVVLAVQRLKIEHPEVTVILGGPGPSGVAHQLLTHFPAIDIIVIGEGERTLIHLLDALAHNRSALASVPGIGYHSGGRVIISPAVARIRPLDILHPLHYTSLEGLAAYDRTFPIISARGCPFVCTFCDVAGLWHRTTTQRSIDNILTELVLLEGLGYERVSFLDDTFTLSYERIEHLCAGIQQQGIQVQWKCNGRVNLVSPKLLNSMVGAGCRKIFYGIESGANTVLKYINKYFTVEKAREVVAYSAQCMCVAVSLIWGFPFESLDDLKRTLELHQYFEQTKNVTSTLYLLAPLPNSSLYQVYQNNLVFNPDLRSSISHLRSLSTEEQVLILTYPNVFPSFYHYHTADLEEKITLVRETLNDK